jgi:Family of unknown function (DUF5677)
MTTPYPESLVEPAEFRARIQAKYAAEFGLCFEILNTLEQAYQQRISLPTDVHRTLDMLMLQSCRAYSSVYLLAVRAHIEDAAIITRRLMEIAVHAGYVIEPPDESGQRERARRYLAVLWLETPESVKEALSPDYRAAWEQYYTTHKHLLPKRNRPRDPNFSDMFRELGREETHVQDYAFLSGLAHGHPPNLIYEYRHFSIEVRPDRLVPFILRYASRYCLTTTIIWNHLFGVIDDAILDALIQRAG